MTMKDQAASYRPNSASKKSKSAENVEHKSDSILAVLCSYKLTWQRLFPFYVHGVLQAMIPTVGAHCKSDSTHSID